MPPAPEPEGTTSRQRPAASQADLALERAWEEGQQFIGAVYEGHDDWVTSATPSPDGEKLLTAGLDHHLMIWKVETAELLDTLTLQHPARYFAGRPQFSADSSHVLAVTVAGKVHLGPWKDRTELPVLPAGDDAGLATRAVLGPDDDLVAIGYVDGTARVVRRSALGDEPRILGAPDNDQITDLAISINGLLATGSERGVVRLWDLQDHDRPVMESEHGGAVRTVTFDARGHWLLSASDDNTAKLHNVAAADHAAVTLSGHTDQVLSAVFSPNGALVATCSVDTTARLYRVPEPEAIAVLAGHTDEIMCVDFDRDNRTVVTASDDGTVRRWDGFTGGALDVLRLHSGLVFTAVHGPKGRVFTAGADNTALRIDIGSETLYAGNTNTVNSAVFDSTGSQVVTACDDRTCRIFDAESAEELQVIEEPWAVNTATFGPDDLVVTATGYEVRVWEWKTPRLRAKLHLQTTVNTAEFSGDGTQVVMTLHPRYSIHDPFDTPHGLIWNWQTDEEFQLRLPDEQARKPFAILADACASPDGRWIAGAVFNKTVNVWNANRELVHTLQGHQGFVYSCAFSQDSKLLVSAGGDGTVRIWDPEEGREIGMLTSPAIQLRSAAFNRDATLVVASAADRRVAVWRVINHKPLAVVRHHAGLVNTAVFHPNRDDWILTASDDQTARLFAYRPMDLTSVPPPEDQPAQSAQSGPS